MRKNSLMSSLVSLLGSLPINEISRERIALLKEQAEAMDKHILQLEEENRLSFTFAEPNPVTPAGV